MAVQPIKHNRSTRQYYVKYYGTPDRIRTYTLFLARRFKCRVSAISPLERGAPGETRTPNLEVKGFLLFH